MSYIVFSIQDSLSYRAVKESLCNIAPELTERDNILVLIEDASLFVDFRNRMSSILDGVVFGDFLAIYGSIENKADIMDNCNPRDDVIIFVQDKSVLLFGFLKDVKRRFEYGMRVGVLYLSNGVECLVSKDVYSDIVEVVDLTTLPSIGSDYSVISYKQNDVIAMAGNLFIECFDSINDKKGGLKVRRLGYRNELGINYYLRGVDG